MTRACLFALLLVCAAGPARADFCMLTQNGLRLGHGEAAYRQEKRAVLRDAFDDYDAVALQEVMDPAEAARLAPPGFTAHVSPAKGRSSYREHYAVLTRDAAMRVLATADYPDPDGAFARPPFGVAVEDAQGARFWLVAIHVVFGTGGAEPRRVEVAAMAAVVEFFAARVLPDGGTADRVVVAGDWNLPARDRAFAGLPAGLRAAPDVPSSLNARGEAVSPYDHYLWAENRLSVAFAAEPRDSAGLDRLRFRRSVSDHVGVAGYVMAVPGAAMPPGTVCPPQRRREISAAP